MILRYCPACEAKPDLMKDINHIIDFPDPDQGKLMICTNCGHIMFNPHKSEEELEKFYESTYRSAVTASNIITCKRKLEYIKKMLDEHLVEGGKTLLDFGCAQGYLLEHYRKYGNVCEGVEPTKGFRQFGEGFYKLKIYDKERSIPADKKYDVICLYHVLEHIDDPRDTIARLAEHLNEDGKFLISVPYLSELVHQSDGQCQIMNHFLPYEHVHMFTVKSFHNLMGSLGFKAVSVNTTFRGLTVILERMKPGDSFEFIRDDWEQNLHILEDMKACLEKFRSLNKASEEIVERYKGMLKDAMERSTDNVVIDTQMIGEDRQHELFDTQKRIMREALEIYPYFSELWLILSELYNKDGYNETQKILEDGLKYMPQSHEILATFGMNQYRRGMINEARETLIKSHDLKPANDMIMMHIGLSFLEKGLINEGTEWLTASYKINDRMFDQYYSMLGHFYSK